MVTAFFRGGNFNCRQQGILIVAEHAWVFKGTRIPVSALFENLEDGATADDFLAWFPGVERRQVQAVLEHANRSLDQLATQ